jgi:hypothetical protein
MGPVPLNLESDAGIDGVADAVLDVNIYYPIENSIDMTKWYNDLESEGWEEDLMDWKDEDRLVMFFLIDETASADVV